MSKPYEKKTKIPYDYEDLIENEHGNRDDGCITGSTRAKVIGGWIVNNYWGESLNGRVSLSQSSVFVPDPNHEWEIEDAE